MPEIKEKHPSWFKLKIERRQLIKQLPPETAVNVLLACWEYLETCEIPDTLQPLEKIAFSAFFPDMEEAWQRYEQRVNAKRNKSVDTAMLLLMIERGMPIDMVLSADTGMEFPEMYEHLAKLDEHLFRERGIHITTLRHPKGFEYLMFDEPKQKPRSLENRARLGIPPYGNGWPGIRVRWCTGQLKTHLITKEVNRLKGELGAIHYVGIAADEAWRCKDERYPLVEWGITEAQALQACYDRGFDFGGLYEIYHRASCWCCPFQRIDELRKLRKHHPELWEKLLELDRRALAQFGPGPLGQFKQNWSVKRLDTRFAEEDSQTG